MQLTGAQTEIICNWTCNHSRRPAIIQCKPGLFATDICRWPLAAAPAISSYWSMRL